MHTSFYIHTSFYAFYACHVECNEVNYIQYLYFPPHIATKSEWLVLGHLVSSLQTNYPISGDRLIVHHYIHHPAHMGGGPSQG